MLLKIVQQRIVSRTLIRTGMMRRQVVRDHLGHRVAHAGAVGVAAAVPMTVVFFLCLRWPLGPLRALHRFMQVVVRPLFRVCTLFDLAVISLLAGIGEELFFRGFLLFFIFKT